jgi:hypothetical protein
MAILRPHGGRLLVAALYVAATCLASRTVDGNQPISNIIFHMSVVSALGSADYVACFEEGVWDPEEQIFSWALPDEIELSDPFTGQWLATLTDATVFVRIAGSGEIELNLGVISGPADTDVLIRSPLVTLAEPIPAGYARGRASTSITLTDGENDDAFIMGMGGDGSGIYQSFYNGFLTSGTRFTHLVGLIAIEGGGTVTASQSDPVVGYRRIQRAVRDLSAEIVFTISPLELAYATTTLGFPEPPPCPGDLNGDGRISTDDLAELLAHYGYCAPHPNFRPESDLNGDGCIDMMDLGELLSLFGIACW